MTENNANEVNPELTQKLLKAIFDEGYAKGYQEGFDNGVDAEVDDPDVWEEAFNEGYEAGEEEGYNNGIYSDVVKEQVAEAFAAGLAREQNRIHQVIDMQMRWAEEQNKGRDYIFWKNVKEILTPINFEPWSEERWAEEMEKDGF